LQERLEQQRSQKLHEDEEMRIAQLKEAERKLQEQVLEQKKRLERIERMENDQRAKEKKPHAKKPKKGFFSWVFGFDQDDAHPESHEQRQDSFVEVPYPSPPNNGDRPAPIEAPAPVAVSQPQIYASFSDDGKGPPKLWQSEFAFGNPQPVKHTEYENLLSGFVAPRAASEQQKSVPTSEKSSVTKSDFDDLLSGFVQPAQANKSQQRPQIVKSDETDFDSVLSSFVAPAQAQQPSNAGSQAATKQKDNFEDLLKNFVSEKK